MVQGLAATGKWGSAIFRTAERAAQTEPAWAEDFVTRRDSPRSAAQELHLRAVELDQVAVTERRGLALQGHAVDAG